MIRRLTSYILFPVALLIFGCADDSDDLASPDVALFEEQQQVIEQYLDERDITTQQNEAGVRYRVLTENPNGESPEPGNIVNLYYRIEQLEGGIVAVREDSSSQEPVAYTFGFSSNNPLIYHLIFPIGLDNMVNTMREGEEYEFFLPSAYAYLDYELGDTLAPNAIIRARIHLTEVLTTNEQRHVEDAKIKAYLAAQGLHDADSLASGVYYQRTEEGSGDAVSEGSQVQVRYTGQLLDGTIFDSNTAADRELYEFTVGASERQPIEGFLLGIRQMRSGEKGTVVMPSHAAYGQGLISIPYAFVSDRLNEIILNPRDYGFARAIPPYSPLRFDIEVVGVN